MADSAWLREFAPTAAADAPWHISWHGPMNDPPDPLQRHWQDLLAAPGSHCYAVLDAALLTNLPEWLEAAELRHECLFDGASRDELRHVAPWLVEVTQNSPLLPAVSLSTEQNPHGWGQDAGIFLCSTLEFAAMRKHLRRFTRLRRTDGTWVYFRFWQPEVLGALCLRGPMGFIASLLAPDRVTRLVLPTEGHVLTVTPIARADPPAPSPVPTLTPDVERALGAHVTARFQHRLCVTLATDSGLSRDKTMAVIDHVTGLGFRSRAVVTALAAWWCTPDGARALSQVWAQQELTDSAGMPDTVRLDRLRNLAADHSDDERRPANAAG